MASEANSETALAGVTEAMGAASIVEEQLKPEEAMSEDRLRQAEAIAARAETVTFATLGLPEWLLHSIQGMNYTTPSQIQALAIPAMMGYA
jgi:superfamily II DNA/RNA helicase